MNTEIHNDANDDLIRAAMRSIASDTPTAPGFDEVIDRAARLGVAAPSWATDRYDLPEVVRATRRRRRTPRAFMASLLTIGVLGGGGYLAYAGFVGPDGYDSPTEATDAFLGALEDGNLLKASRALVPWERDGLEAQLRTALADAQRADLLATNDLGNAKNISLRRNGLQFTEVPMATGFTRVEATAGSLDLTLDRGLFGDGPDKPTDLPKTVDLLEQLAPRDEDQRTGRPGLVTVRDDGDWYVSLSYSIADHLRVSKGVALPDLVSPPAPAGADTPEQAMTMAFRGLYGGSTGELMAVLDPVSGGAILRYTAVLRSPDTPDGAGSGSGADEPSDVTRWSAAGTGDRRTVTLAEYTTGSPDPTGGAITLTSEQRCVSYAPGDPCVEPLPASYWDRGFTAIRRDGRWYVDPVSGAVDLFLGTFATRTARFESAAVSSGVESSIGSDGPGVATLDALAGTSDAPPEARLDAGNTDAEHPAGRWSLAFQAGIPPSPQVLHLVSGCLAASRGPEDQRPTGAGGEFPLHFFDCVGEVFGGWEFNSRDVAAAPVSPTSAPF